MTLTLLHFVLQSLQSTLSDLAELRYNVENSLVKFKEACDVGSVANIKYCIRTIANRASSTKGLSLKLVSTTDLVSIYIYIYIRIHISYTLMCINYIQVDT